MRRPFRLPACKCVFRDSFMVPHTTFPEGQLRSPNTQIAIHYSLICFGMWLGPALCAASAIPSFWWQWETHTRKNSAFSSAGWSPAPFKHRYFHLLLRGHPACLNSPIAGWIQDSEELVMVLGGEWSQCYSIKYSLDLFFTGVWTVNSGAWAEVQLISPIPWWYWLHRTLHIFCTKLLLVLPHTTNQLPFFRPEMSGFQGFLCP